MTIRGAFRLLILAARLAPATTIGQTTPSWTQWGGAGRDFMSDSKGLASTWPASGPKKLWSRECSARVTPRCSSRTAVSTRCTGSHAQPSVSHEEVVAALDAASGKTSGNSNTRASPTGIQFDQGFGPHSTPLIVGNRALRRQARAASCSRSTRRPASASGRTTSSRNSTRRSPLAATAAAPSSTTAHHRDDGRAESGRGGLRPGIRASCCGRAAFSCGRPRRRFSSTWTTSRNSSCLAATSLPAWIPRTAAELWRHPHKTDWGLNISTPLWLADQHLLLVSSAYGVGSARARTPSVRRQDDGHREVAEPADAHSHRHHHSPRRARLRLER